MQMKMAMPSFTLAHLLSRYFKLINLETSIPAAFTLLWGEIQAPQARHQPLLLHASSWTKSLFAHT